MRYDSQPAGNIPLYCNGYQPIFPTLAMSLSIVHSTQTVECDSVLRPVRFPSDSAPRTGKRFSSHGRGNPYSAHQRLPNKPGWDWENAGRETLRLFSGGFPICWPGTPPRAVQCWLPSRSPINVKHSLGKGEVVSSILTGSTRIIL